MLRHPLLWCALLALSGCGPLREPYTVIHAAWLADDGASVVVLAETGVATLNLGSFTAVRNHDSDSLTVWRLDRRTGGLRELVKRPTPAGFNAFHGPVTPAQSAAMSEASGTAAGTPLPDCGGALTQCAVRTSPLPFAVRDQREGRDRGRRIVDPAAGVTLQGLGRTVAVQPYALRTTEAVERARGEAIAATAARILEAARAYMADSLAKTGTLPTARSSTIIDSAIAGGVENMIPTYAVAPGGRVSAEIVFGGEPPISLRWAPRWARRLEPSNTSGPDGLPQAFECETDREDAARSIAGCIYRP